MSIGIVGGFGTLGPIQEGSDTYTITTAVIASTTGVQPDGSLIIVKNDAYAAADSRGLSWQSSSWPSLVGASVSLSISDLAGVNVFINRSAGTVVDASTVAFDLTSTQTDSLPLNPTTGKGLFRFSIEATLASGNTITLLVGKAAAIAPAYRV